MAVTARRDYQRFIARALMCLFLAPENLDFLGLPAASPAPSDGGIKSTALDWQQRDLGLSYS